MRFISDEVYFIPKTDEISELKAKNKYIFAQIESLLINHIKCTRYLGIQKVHVLVSTRISI